MQSKPAVVATHAALLQQAGDAAGAAALLAQALQQQKAGSPGAAWLLTQLAGVELQGGNLKGAMRHLQQLLAASPAAAGEGWGSHFYLWVGGLCL